MSATFARSNNIFGRIQRMLRVKGIPADAIQAAEIYDEMNEGQKQIYIRAKMDLEKSILLTVGKSEYDLSDVTTARQIYGDIVDFILPAGWEGGLDFVSPGNWNNILSCGDYDGFKNPVKATIYANILRLYPAPISAATIKLYAHLIMPVSDISATLDPEIPEFWDKAIEDYALYRLLGDEKFYQTFLEQVNTINVSQNYRGFRIQRPRVIW